MSDAAGNPYEAAPASVLKPSGRMEYMRSFHFIFENPNWTANVMWCALCLLSTAIIPVIGQLILIGYLFEVIEAIHTRRTATYPDFKFDFDRLIEYLVRGFWVFLVQLVLTLVLLPVVLGGVALIAVIIGVAGAGGGEEGAGIAAMVAIPVSILVLFGLFILLNLYMVPITLRAGLSQEFAEAFNFSFMKQFVRLTWVEIIISGLFLFAAGFIAEVVGLLMFCVGIIFTMMIVYLMYAHLGLQLYELHLARGGEPIPLKPERSDVK
jgi:hypothetical protein